MNDLLNILIAVGPGSLLLALVLAIIAALLGRMPRDPRGRAKVGRYVVGVGVAGAVGFFVGSAVGIAVFCTAEKAGTLCGLGGIFGVGPLLAGLAIAGYVHRQARAATQPPV